jgi:hypothetical protein
MSEDMAAAARREVRLNVRGAGVEEGGRHGSVLSSHCRAAQSAAGARPPAVRACRFSRSDDDAAIAFDPVSAETPRFPDTIPPSGQNAAVVQGAQGWPLFRHGDPMMRNLVRALAAAGLLAFSAPVLAQGVSDQTASEGSGQEILVEGNRIPEKRIEAFVDAVAGGRIFDQLRQFTEGVCPASIGPSPAQNALIVQRIRRVATAAGVPLAPENCDGPNLLVIVARDKAEVVRGLAKKHWGLVSGLSNQEVRRLANSPDPAAAWHVEWLLNADGLPTSRDQVSGIQRVEVGSFATRLRPASRPTFVGAVVVLELNALGGLSLTQVADYAALRTLATIDPRRLRNVDAPSILTMFDDRAAGREPALSLTHWDLSYLTGLYATTNDQYAASQRGRIERLMKKDPDLAIQPER